MRSSFLIGASAIQPSLLCSSGWLTARALLKLRQPARICLPTGVERRHPLYTYVVTEADAAVIREVYERDGELSAAVELRRRFPGITDNAIARNHARWDRRLGIDARAASGASTQRESRAVDGGSITLQEVAAHTDVLAVVCSRCERTGRYQMATLIEAAWSIVSFVPGAVLLSVDCVKRKSVSQYDLCGVHCPSCLRCSCSPCRPTEGAVYGSGIGGCSATWPSHRDHRPVGRSARRLWVVHKFPKQNIGAGSAESFYSKFDAYCQFSDRHRSPIMSLPQNRQRVLVKFYRSETRAVGRAPTLGLIAFGATVDQTGGSSVQTVQVSMEAFKPLLGLTDLAGDFSPFADEAMDNLGLRHARYSRVSGASAPLLCGGG